jgi:hypothetical protein
MVSRGLVVRGVGTAALIITLALSFSACKGPNDDEGSLAPGSGSPGDGGSSGGSGSYKGPVALHMTADPSVKWNPADGKTTVVLQYTVRGANNVPLQKGQYLSSMWVDGRALDAESLLDSASEDLAVQLNFTEVLDASYSMTQHSPPAFEPMKKAAADTYQGILDTWSQRPGEVYFRAIWFDEVINETVNNPNTARKWQPGDLLTIPAPSAGTATKLYGAAQKMAELMKADFDAGSAAGPRDHHVMLLFSDGADNYSWFANASAPKLLSTSNGASYNQYGLAAATLDGVKAAIHAHPRLTVHVIGLGSAIDADKLKQIADAGHGVFLQNPSSDKLDELFDQVLLEFTTIQTEGALMPLPPGDYRFTLRVTDGKGSSKDEYSFSFHGGDSSARVLQ